MLGNMLHTNLHCCLCVCVKVLRKKDVYHAFASAEVGLGVRVVCEKF